MNQEFKKKIKKRLYEMMNSGDVLDASTENTTPTENSPRQTQTTPSINPPNNDTQSGNSTDHPDPQNWPQTAPTYFGPNGEQIWVLPGPPPSVYVWIPGEEGSPGQYSIISRKSVGGAGLNQYFRWRYLYWSNGRWREGNNPNATSFNDILRIYYEEYGLHKWIDPRGAPGSEWQVVPQPGTLDIPGEAPWLSNPGASDPQNPWRQQEYEYDPDPNNNGGIPRYR